MRGFGRRAESFRNTLIVEVPLDANGEAIPAAEAGSMARLHSMYANQGHQNVEDFYPYRFATQLINSMLKSLNILLFVHGTDRFENAALSIFRGLTPGGAASSSTEGVRSQVHMDPQSIHSPYANGRTFREKDAFKIFIHFEKFFRRIEEMGSRFGVVNTRRKPSIAPGSGTLLARTGVHQESIDFVLLQSSDVRRSYCMYDSLYKRFSIIGVRPMKDYDSQTLRFHSNEVYEKSMTERGSRHATEKRTRNLDEERRLAAEVDAEKVAELRRLVQMGQASLAQQEMYLKRERDMTE